MRIGVFGDSYAEKNSKPNTIWWSILSTKYGHDVECFGESGSSLLFSAKKVLKKKNEYDLVIWCTTQPGRMTLEYFDVNHHFQISKNVESFAGNDIQRKFKVFQDYWVELMDWEDEKFVSRCVVESVQNACQNLLIVPAFRDPADSFFNLYSLSKREINSYFKGRIPDNLSTDYIDQRVGHLSQKSQEILSDLLSVNLRPGVFQTDFNHFPEYDDPPFLKKKIK